MSMTDKQKELISEIYTDHRENVFYHVLSMVKNRHDAEDITNDVFFKMINLDSVKFDINNEKKATIITWLHTITNHVVIDYFRKNNKHQKLRYVEGFINDEVYQFVAPISTNADVEILTSEIQNSIVSAFHSLKPKYRRIATLYFIREHKYNEIATMLNIPEGTVKGMLFRCRAKLQESLKVAQMA